MTGLPQPKPRKRRARVPSGSRCARGSRVRRPWARGVGSPSVSAALAWAYSWIEMASIRPIAQMRNRSGLLKSVDSIVAL